MIEYKLISSLIIEANEDKKQEYLENLMYRAVDLAEEMGISISGTLGLRVL